MDAQKDPSGRRGACTRIGVHLGIPADTIRGWVRPLEIDQTCALALQPMMQPVWQSLNARLLHFGGARPPLTTISYIDNHKQEYVNLLRSEVAP